MSTKRRAFSDEFKAKVALEALKEQQSIAQIASRYDVLPVQVSQWKVQLMERLPGLFAGGRKREKEEQDWQAREAQLFQKIGQLEVERDWLKKKATQLGLLPGGKTSHD
jgi:transposase